MAKRTVNSQMPQQKLSTHGVGGGIYDRNKAPFDKPHDTGGGGIPLKFFDGTREPSVKGTPSKGQSGTPVVGTRGQSAMKRDSTRK